MKQGVARLAALALAMLLATGCGNADTALAQTAVDPGVPGSNAATDPSKSAAARRLQTWRARGYGMFIHWGLYSELGGMWNGERVTRGYSEQIEKWAGIPHADYMRVAERFSADKFDADEICTLAKDAGARYIVVTSKHHDGFAMFDTASTDYDIVDRTPFGRDPLKLLSDACRKQGLGFGVYFSLVDWNAGHVFDPDNDNAIPASMEPLIEQQLRELMTNYGPIAEVWFDMSSPTPEQSRGFAAIVRDLQPDAAINGRIWNNVGDFVTLGDNQAPPASIEPPFQVPASIYHATWGYRSWQERSDAAGKVRELVRGLAATRAAGGNYLLNIGPKGDGGIVPFEADVLRGVGAWVSRHREAVMDSMPSRLPKQDWGVATIRGRTLYLLISEWPRDGVLRVRGLANTPREVAVDGVRQPEPLTWRRDGQGLDGHDLDQRDLDQHDLDQHDLDQHDLVVTLPARAPDPLLPVLRIALDEELRAVPSDAVTVTAGAPLRIPRAQWRDGTSFEFGSGYYSQRDSLVSLSTTLIAQRDARMRLRFDNVAAQAGRRYRISVGNQAHEIDGSALRSQSIGPFGLAAGVPVPVEIRLAQPAYPAQDLGLLFDATVLLPDGVQERPR